MSLVIGTVRMKNEVCAIKPVFPGRQLLTSDMVDGLILYIDTPSTATQRPGRKSGSKAWNGVM